jgi:hypothetical protein
MFGACFGRISESRLSKRASGDSNLTSSMPSTGRVVATGIQPRERCVDVRSSLQLRELVVKHFGKQRSGDTGFRNRLVVSVLTRGIAADRWRRARYAPYTLSHND